MATTSPQLRFLKPEDLFVPEEGNYRVANCRIIARGDFDDSDASSIRFFAGKHGPELFVDVAIADDSHEPVLRTFSTKLENPNFISLEKMFGKNLLRWPGRSFRVRVNEFLNSGERRPHLVIIREGV